MGTIVESEEQDDHPPLSPKVKTIDNSSTTLQGKTAVVTPSGDTNSINKQSDVEVGDKDSIRKALFNEEVGVVSVSNIRKRGPITGSSAPSAKRRLVFGRMVHEMEFQPNVKSVYKIIRKLTGGVGGNGHSGPIYGELTMGSMQKMINLMKEHTGLCEGSKFIDVGSGIGKPNFHVAQDPGVAFSCGVEMEHVRWALSMTCLRAVLQSTENINQNNCIFLHRNIQEAKSFDPFTHVYMFSIGFPPPLWVDLSKMWNVSQSDFLICFHGPKDVVKNYGFKVELVAQTPTSMHGSKEGHTGYIYKRTGTTRQKGGEDDAIFNDAWNLVQGGNNSSDLLSIGDSPLYKWVWEKMGNTMSNGPTTRSQRKAFTR